MADSEFGGMGLEGEVKLGYKKELDAIDDLKEREEAYQKQLTDVPGWQRPKHG